MVTATRTIGPLHLEDLEPHRFEDLVRQLLYDFREWRSLEATGRSGGDEGFDARGWEAVARTPVGVETELEGDEIVEQIDERLWLVQCKREKSMGPRKLLGYLDDLHVVERRRVYGIVFVAACDFSKTARDSFRARTRELGFNEAYLWGKAELEDQLFQPKNDHLLFAYFGVSLQVRRRTIKTEVRALLAMKRKAKRLLNTHTPALFRDATDQRYPYLDEDETLNRVDRGRWRVFEVEGCKSDGVYVKSRGHYAFIDEDGEHWDFAERMNDALVTSFNPWLEDHSYTSEDRTKACEIWNALPEQDRAWYAVFLILPYENIIDIDEDGDEWFEGPHVYTTEAHPVHGPFRANARDELQTTDPYHPRKTWPEEEKRVHKFPRKERDNKKRS
jgi:hypothetical protein